MKKGFTLIELIAVIVVLSIILAITVPTIIGIIETSTKNAFESDAKMVLKAVDYKKLLNEDFNPEVINKDNIYELLGLSNANYTNISIYIEDNIPEITIIGKGKWNGLIACGTYKDIKVVKSTKDCNNDITPPVITILGDNPFNMYAGDSYSDPGATAEDDRDGDITDKIAVTGTVNPNVAGTYTITCSVMDKAMNETYATRTVNIIDIESPMINFDPNGNSTYAKRRSTKITVSDIGGLNNETLKYVWTTSLTEPSLDLFTSSIVSGGTIQTPVGLSGSYYLWATATDKSNNRTTTRSNVFNLDNEKPVITLNGESNITINKGSTYTDAGATATDNIDDVVTVTSSGTVNPNVIGTYTITYNATDSSGNEANPATRTINVIDVQAPIITVLGDNPTTIDVGSTYSDAGATAIDDVDGDLTSSIVTTGTVNPSVIGTYTITYKVTDSSNNTATATRTVNVVDNVLPTITFGTNGNSTYAKSRTTKVTVSDNVIVNTSSLKYLWNTSTTKPSEASITNGFTNGATINSPAGATGDYYLWILAKDTSGNTTIQRTSVFKLDNTIPVITVNPATVTITEGSVYTDTGVTASDAHSGINGSITSTGTVNPNVPGTYTITYTVSDKAGNTATKTRTVTVLRGDYDIAKGVNYPKLSTGMTPIKWNGSTWVDTTEDDSDWYDYTAKKWANARTADGSMWVWIPRYIYKITSGWHSATAGKIEVQFSKGTNDNWNSSVIGNIDTGTTSNASNNKWTNHPAFNFGGTQLTGFWVAKFEASSYDTWCDNELASGCSTSSCKSACDRTISSPAFKPNAYSWRTVSVNNAFILSLNMETNSKYGWGTSGSGIDTHLMKNVEWGAVAYLTTSIYGNNNLLWRNNSYPYTTGCVGNSINAGAYWEGCAYQYHTGNGVRGSTTGNIYGVYDLRGGGNEILAAYIDNNHDTLNQHGSSLVSAASKYKDVYPTSYNNTINKKGDAFYETSNRDTGRYAWNNSHIGSPGFFIERGGFTNSGDTTSQIFGITFSTGGSDTGTFRTVLLVGEGL